MKLLILFLILLPQLVLGQSHCSTPISKEEMADQIKEIKDRYFPKLKDIDLRLEVLKSNAYFLQTCVKARTAFKSPLKRSYGVQVNEKVFLCSHSLSAITAILIHEIAHISDYVKMSGLKLAVFGLRYSIDKRFRTRYERQTDEKALLAGETEGLKDYRYWVYQWLNPKQVKVKKRYYYTPEEIDQWILENP